MSWHNVALLVACSCFQLASCENVRQSQQISLLKTLLRQLQSLEPCRPQQQPQNVVIPYPYRQCTPQGSTSTFTDVSCTPVKNTGAPYPEYRIKLPMCNGRQVHTTVIIELPRLSMFKQSKENYDVSPKFDETKPNIPAHRPTKFEFVKKGTESPKKTAEDVTKSTKNNDGRGKHDKLQTSTDVTESQKDKSVRKPGQFNEALTETKTVAAVTATIATMSSDGTNTASVDAAAAATSTKTDEGCTVKQETPKTHTDEPYKNKSFQKPKKSPKIPVEPSTAASEDTTTATINSDDRSTTPTEEAAAADDSCTVEQETPKTHTDEPYKDKPVQKRKKSSKIPVEPSTAASGDTTTATTNSDDTSTPCTDEAAAADDGCTVKQETPKTHTDEPYKDKSVQKQKETPKIPLESSAAASGDTTTATTKSDDTSTTPTDEAAAADDGCTVKQETPKTNTDEPYKDKSVQKQEKSPKIPVEPSTAASGDTTTVTTNSDDTSTTPTDEAAAADDGCTVKQETPKTNTDEPYKDKSVQKQKETPKIPVESSTAASGDTTTATTNSDDASTTPTDEAAAADDGCTVKQETPKTRTDEPYKNKSVQKQEKPLKIPVEPSTAASGDTSTATTNSDDTSTTPTDEAAAADDGCTVKQETPKTNTDEPYKDKSVQKQEKSPKIPVEPSTAASGDTTTATTNSDDASTTPTDEAAAADDGCTVKQETPKMNTDEPYKDKSVQKQEKSPKIPLEASTAASGDTTTATTNSDDASTTPTDEAAAADDGCTVKQETPKTNTDEPYKDESVQKQEKSPKIPVEPSTAASGDTTTATTNSDDASTTPTDEAAAADDGCTVKQETPKTNTDEPYKDESVQKQAKSSKIPVEPSTAASGDTTTATTNSDDTSTTVADAAVAPTSTKNDDESTGKKDKPETHKDKSVDKPGQHDETPVDSSSAAAGPTGTAVLVTTVGDDCDNTSAATAEGVEVTTAD